MTGSRLRLLFVPLIVVAIAGGGQPPGLKDPSEKKDPQSSIEPRSGPGAGQKFLEKFVGDWTVVKTFHPRSGDPVKQNGECKQTMMHDGRFLKSEFIFVGEKAKTTGTGIIGFDPAAGLFTSVWTDSRSTRMSFRQGKEKFNGQEIVLESQGLGDAKETRHSRTVTRLEENGNKIVHRQYGTGADGNERLIMELLMTRKGDNATPR